MQDRLKWTQSALVRILRPAVRLALAMGLKHAQLEEMLRDLLLEEVWGYSYDGDNNVVDVYIRYLRNKLDADKRARYIHTIRGVGYLFRYEEAAHR